MTLDAYLRFRSLTVPQFGRRLRTLKHPHQAGRYLKLLQSGRVNLRFRRPDWPQMLDIYEQTERLVAPNDWI